MKINYLSGMNSSASALSAYRQWMNTIAGNLANAQTTRTAQGGPYRRQQVSFEAVETQQASSAKPGESASTLTPSRTHGQHMTAGLSAGLGSTTQSTVQVKISQDNETPFTQIYDPAHPDAGNDGFVQYPNVNPVTEMVNLILASRAYEANVAALATDKRMQEMALSIGK